MADKESREEFRRNANIDAAGIVHGPGEIVFPKEMLWHDTLQYLSAHLEAFADEFERRAQTPAQKALADTFAAFVSDFTRERLSMAALGELGAELEAFDMDEIDVALAGELIELGESAGQAWQRWMDDQPIYAIEQVKDGRWVVWNTRDMEPEDIFANEALARECAETLNSKRHHHEQQRSTSKEATAAELAARLFGDGAHSTPPPAQRPDAFDRAVANLRRQWCDDGLDEWVCSWRELSPEGKVGYLATWAALHDVPFERFAKAAQHVLHVEAWSPDDEWNLRRQYREANAARAAELTALYGSADARQATPEMQKEGPQQERGGRER